MEAPRQRRRGISRRRRAPSVAPRPHESVPRQGGRAFPIWVGGRSGAEKPRSSLPNRPRSISKQRRRRGSPPSPTSCAEVSLSGEAAAFPIRVGGRSGAEKPSRSPRSSLPNRRVLARLLELGSEERSGEGVARWCLSAERPPPSPMEP
jgi:hypothetical protein